LADSFPARYWTLVVLPVLYDMFEVRARQEHLV